MFNYFFHGLYVCIMDMQTEYTCCVHGAAFICVFPSLHQNLKFSLPDCNVPAHKLYTVEQSVLSLLISQPTSSSSFPPPPPPPQTTEKLSLRRTLRGGERCSGPMGSCSSSTERLPFKHTHLLTNSNNGLHGCQFSELHTLTSLPPLGLLADIKEPLFTHTGTQLITGFTDAGLPRVSSIHHCPVMDN